MSSVSKVIITIVIVIVAALGVWWLVGSMSNNSQEQTGSQTEETNETSNDESDDQEAAVTITYDGTAFAPASTTVNVGDVIRITNNSENTLYFASDEHPTHLDNSELNVGDIEPGNSATFSISGTGTWGYHDHYNASASGQIVVE